MRLTEIFVGPHRPGPENFKIWIDNPVAGEIAMLQQQSFEIPPTPGLSLTCPFHRRKILPPVIGQTILHYRVVEKLGGGDTGVVDTTEDVTLHRLSKSDFGSGVMAGAVYRL